MFKELFNFSFQRSTVQAIGFYLFYFVLAFALGAVAGIVAYRFNLFPGNDFRSGLRAGSLAAPIIPIVIGGLVAWSRPFSPTTVLTSVVSLALALFAGWLGAGIAIAFLTTQPARVRSA